MMRLGAGVKLDHVSISSSVGELERLGFRATLTSGSAGRHARVLFDRSYLEVVAPPDLEAPLAGRAWFMRPADPRSVAADLRRRGVPTSEPVTYKGHDGTWLDVQIELPHLAAVLPVLTRRLDVAAADWPPPLDEPHPNGAVSINELRMRAREPEALGCVLGALGARPAADGRFVFVGGLVVVVDPAASSPEGIAAIVVRRRDGPPLPVQFG
jgi:Glyoxalase-like domain